MSITEEATEAHNALFEVSVLLYQAWEESYNPVISDDKATLEWGGRKYTSRIVVDIESGSSVYTLVSTDGTEIKRIEYPSLGDLKQHAQILVAGDAWHWSTLAHKYADMVTRIQSVLESREVESTLTVGEFEHWSLEWVDTGILTVLSVWEGDYSQICAFKYGEKVLVRQYESFEELEADYMNALDIVLPVK